MVQVQNPFKPDDLVHFTDAHEQTYLNLNGWMARKKVILK